MTQLLAPGTPAPNALHVTPDQSLSLADLAARRRRPSAHVVWEGHLDALEKMSNRRSKMSLLRVPVMQADHVPGRPEAPVNMVEYGDYECPFCGLAHPIIKRVQKHFGRQPRFAYRHFPLAQVHPHAQDAAETAFAGAQGCFWEMHDGLFENQASLGVALFFALAATLDLPEEELRTALDTEAYAAKVRSDFTGGVRSGASGTPTFLINGHPQDGSFDFGELVGAADAFPKSQRLSLVAVERGVR